MVWFVWELWCFIQCHCHLVWHCPNKPLPSFKLWPYYGFIDCYQTYTDILLQNLFQTDSDYMNLPITYPYQYKGISNIIPIYHNTSTKPIKLKQIPIQILYLQPILILVPIKFNLGCWLKNYVFHIFPSLYLG